MHLLVLILHVNLVCQYVSSTLASKQNYRRGGGDSWFFVLLQSYHETLNDVTGLRRVLDYILESLMVAFLESMKQM